MHGLRIALVTLGAHLALGARPQRGRLQGGARQPVPEDWKCYPEWFGDSLCDCNCGAPDVDCSRELEEGEELLTFCGSTLVESCEPEHCPAEVPVGFACRTEDFLRPADVPRTCSCNCNVPDPACSEEDLAACLQPPDYWTLDEDENYECFLPNFQDGIVCDCSVSNGEFNNETTVTCSDDPDCADFACQALVAGASFGPPKGWTCSDEAYGDLTCDCDCGVPDPNCAVGYCETKASTGDGGDDSTGDGGDDSTGDGDDDSTGDGDDDSTDDGDDDSTDDGALAEGHVAVPTAALVGGGAGLAVLALLAAVGAFFVGKKRGVAQSRSVDAKSMVGGPLYAGY